MMILHVLFLIVLQWQLISAVVTVGPDITSQAEVNENASILLKCNAQCNNGSCQYNWTGFGLPSRNTENILNLSPVYRNNSNKPYICTVWDNDNVLKKDTHSFRVNYGPDDVTIHAGPKIAVKEGENSESKNLVCTTGDCDPICTIFYWTFKGRNVSDSNRLFKTNKKILRDDDGIYTCTVSNGKTTPKTAQITVTVNYAPVVQLKWNEENKGFECKAIGKPNNYTLKGFKHYVENTLVRTFPGTFKGDTATISLPATNYQDSGRYECHVSNDITNLETGTTTQIDKIDVKIPDLPVIVDSAESYNISKGHRLVLETILYSYPIVNNISVSGDNSTLTCDLFIGNISLACETQNVPIKFHRIDVQPKGQKLTLTFEEMQEENFKTYTFYIQNKFGKTPLNVTIFPEGPPDMPTSFHKTASSHDSLTFTVVTGFYNGGRQTIVVEHKKAGDQLGWSNFTMKNAGVEKNQRVELTVENLSEETMYEFQAYAFNEYNRSEYTAVIKEKTDKAPVSAGLIVGSVLGVVIALAIVVAVVIVLLRRYRRRKKESEIARSTAQNKDLTLEMPTTPGIEKNRNVYVQEPVTPEFPSQTIIYENTSLGTAQMTSENRADPAAGYDVPRSHAPYLKENRCQDRNVDLYDVPRSQMKNSMAPYDVPRSQTNNVAPYDVPRSQTTNPSGRVDLYDLPRSQGLVGRNRKNEASKEGVIPPYLDLNNPNPVEEAYLNVNESKRLIEESMPNAKLNQQKSNSEGNYLEMNVTGVTKGYMNSTCAKETPYYNTQQSETYENTNITFNKENKNETDGKDYQNIAQYKKEKGSTRMGETPYVNTKKGGGKKRLVNNEETKDYQNMSEYRKKPQQQPSVESQSDMYVEMNIGANRTSGVSIPDHDAPSPPGQSKPYEEEDYINLDISKRKR